MLERTLHVPTESSPKPELVVEQRIVRGGGPDGRCPHVYVDGVKYTNKLLASIPAAAGRKLLIQIDEHDMRTVHGRFESGEDIGVLTAGGVWACHRHSRAIRKAIVSLSAKRQAKTTMADSPLDIFVLSKLAQLSGSER